jgi:hypothetical protein
MVWDGLPVGWTTANMDLEGNRGAIGGAMEPTAFESLQTVFRCHVVLRRGWP